MKADQLFKRFSIGTIWIWLIIFALIPNLLVLITSLLQQGDTELIRIQLTINNYIRIFDATYLRIFLHSLYLAGICTLLCLLLGYPFAYSVARAQDRYKSLLLLFVIIPFWTSSLIRSYAIMAILKAKGLLNMVLLNLGLISHPLPLLYSSTAVLIGLIYSLLPFMILPLYANLEKLDTRLIDAAHDLGANRYQVFTRVVLPLTLPGIISGSMLVLLPAMSMFYIPDLLGGAKNMLVGNLIQNQFLAARNWPMGAAVSIFLILLMGLMLSIYWYNTRDHKEQQNLL